MREPVTAFVGLGANLGDARAVLQSTLAHLAKLPGTRLVRSSRIFRSAPVDAGGPDYLNAVAQLETALSAPDLLAQLQRLEQDAGRERPYRNAPRTLDLDLLLYGQRSLDVPGLRLPHPHLHQRAFALLPLLEIAPDAQIPGIGSAREALALLEIGDIQILA